MNKFPFENFLRRILKSGKPADCRRHVFRKKVAGVVLIEPVRRRWFRKCATCKCRRVYSRTVRCFDCQGYVHKGCAVRAAECGAEQPLPADAFTSNAEPAAVVAGTGDHQRLATAVDVDATTAVDDGHLATAILVGDVDATTAADGGRSATAVIVREEAASLPLPSSAVGDGKCSTRAGHDCVKQPNEVLAAPSVPDAHSDKDSGEIDEQWTIQHDRFSKIDQKIIADRGDYEPAVIPIAHDLRNLKRHPDKLTALLLMKAENDFKNAINDIGLDPFFLHYHTGEQINLYSNYARDSKCPQIIIDTFGSVVSKFKKYDLKNSNHIFLYEASVYDQEKDISFTVSNMLSERHNDVTIFNWLANWKNCKMPLPKIIICDQSLATLSAVVQCFTQYSSLNDYVNVCADLVMNNLPAYKLWIPSCFVRINVANFLKLITDWLPFETVARRVRSFILRSLCLLIKCQSLDDISSLLLSLFIVLINKTDGTNNINDEQTPCETHKRLIINASSSGSMDNETLIEKLLDPERDEKIQSAPENSKSSNDALGNLNNPFQKWAERVYNESKSFLEIGNNINPFYLPEIVPCVIKCMYLVPLWSGLMIPIFGYGNETTTSIVVKSSLNELKNVTFKNVLLPTDIELFLENHIISLRGTSLLKLNHIIKAEDTSKNNKNENSKNHEVNVQSNEKISPIFDESYFDKGDTPAHPSNYPNMDQSTIKNIETKCVEVTITEENETSCSRDVENMAEETTSTDIWNKLTNKMRIWFNLSSNPHQRQLQNIKKLKNLPILKNGSPRSCSGELKSYTVKNYGQVILCNTCAFDSVSSILMVAYCDSINYKNAVDGKENVFVKFIAGIVENGISAKAYSTRAEILMKYLQPNLECIDNDTTMASCETTVGNVIKALLIQLPTIMDDIKCSIPTCTKAVPLSSSYITILVINGNLNLLEEDVKARLMTETSKCLNINQNGENCKGTISIRPRVSAMHLFIELLNWEENATDQNVSSEVAEQVFISLENVPSILTLNNTQYHLRGICCHTHGLSEQRNTVGHYRAYCNRNGENNWELYDDLRTKSIPVNSKTKVPCELLVYSI